MSLVLNPMILTCQQDIQEKASERHNWKNKNFRLKIEISESSVKKWYGSRGNIGTEEHRIKKKCHPYLMDGEKKIIQGGG